VCEGKTVRNYENVLPDLTTIPVSDFEDAAKGMECVVTVGKSTFALTPIPGHPGLFTQRRQRVSLHSKKGARLCKAWDEVLGNDNKPAAFLIEQAEIGPDRSLTIRTDGHSETHRVYKAELRPVEPQRR
jgi:hypothetical protein